MLNAAFHGAQIHPGLAPSDPPILPGGNTSSRPHQTVLDKLFSAHTS